MALSPARLASSSAAAFSETSRSGFTQLANRVARACRRASASSPPSATADSRVHIWISEAHTSSAATSGGGSASQAAASCELSMPSAATGKCAAEAESDEEDECEANTEEREEDDEERDEEDEDDETEDEEAEAGKVEEQAVEENSPAPASPRRKRATAQSHSLGGALLPHAKAN